MSVSGVSGSSQTYYQPWSRNQGLPPDSSQDSDAVKPRHHCHHHHHHHLGECPEAVSGNDRDSSRDCCGSTVASSVAATSASDPMLSPLNLLA